MKKNVVVLLNLGGPDSIEAVKPFLNNLFRDPDIFNILFFQSGFAKLISHLRAKKIEKQYQLIGGNSPINKWTQTQASLLQKEFDDEKENIEVSYGMRYWNPLIREVAARDYSQYEKVILLPLYPHYSKVTTASSFNEWSRYYKGDNHIDLINNYHVHPLYIEGLNNRIEEGLKKLSTGSENAHLLFSAHGVPESLIKSGDPYKDQISETVEKIMQQRDFSNPHHICYQSKVGPVKWLTPSTKDTIISLAEKGVRQMAIIPISFVSDHIETLYELNIVYRKIALDAGIEDFIVTEGLNDSPLFIKALKDIVKRKIKK